MRLATHDPMPIASHNAVPVPCDLCWTAAAFPGVLVAHYEVVHMMGRDAAHRRAGHQARPCPGCGVRGAAAAELSPGGGLLHERACLSPGWSPDRGAVPVTPKPSPDADRQRARHIALPCMRCGVLVVKGSETQKYCLECREAVDRARDRAREQARALARQVPKVLGCDGCERSLLGACAPHGGPPTPVKRAAQYSRQSARRAMVRRALSA